MLLGGLVGATLGVGDCAPATKSSAPRGSRSAAAVGPLPSRPDRVHSCPGPTMASLTGRHELRKAVAFAAPLSNHALQPSHSRVTALAQSRKRRAARCAADCDR